MFLRLMTLAMVTLTLMCIYGADAWARDYTYQIIKVDPQDGGKAVALNNNGMVLGNFGQEYHSGVFTWQAGKVVKYRQSYIQAYGLNDAGDFVGSGFKSHGFIYSGGKFTTLDYPGYDGTVATGINNNGTVVGNYVFVDYPEEQYGFVYEAGKYKSLGPILPVSINQIGDMAAEAVDGYPIAYNYIGVLLTANGVETSIDQYGTPSTAAAINDSDTIAGEAEDIGSLIFQDGTQTYIGSPSCAAGATLFTGINNAGDIVGACTDGSAPFVYHHGVFRTLRTVRGQVLQPIAINNHGQILANTGGGFSVLATPK